MVEHDTAAGGAARLGRYLLLEQLSDSFFGPRWRVQGDGSGPLRAARMVGGESPEQIANAAAAIRSVEHPSLLPPLELVHEPHTLVIVSDHVEGETLRSLLQRAVDVRESIPQEIAQCIALDLLAAMQALVACEQRATPGPHLHGGLTLDSVHIGTDGRTRLLDPGVAAAAARAPGFVRHPVRAAYTAPEHVDGGGNFDVRSDVFSLGVLLWETLACSSLFGAASYEEVRDRVLHAPIKRVQRDRFLRGEPIAAALAVVVARALQREPHQRFQNYEELSDALRSAGSVAEHAQVATFVREGLRSPATLLAPESAAGATEAAPATSASSSPEPSHVSGIVTLQPPAPTVESAAGDPDRTTVFDPRKLLGTDRRRVRGSVVVAIGLVALILFGWIALRRATAPLEPAALPARVERATAAPAPPDRPAAPSPGPAVGSAPAHTARASSALPAGGPSQTAPATTGKPPAAAPQAPAAATGKQGERSRTGTRGRARDGVFVPDDI